MGMDLPEEHPDSPEGRRMVGLPPLSHPYTFRQFYIPERMMGAIIRYIENRIPPGGFLIAVITNNLQQAVARADEENMANIPAYVAYFYNEAPGNCWGSQEKYQDWLKEQRDAHTTATPRW